MHNKNIGYPVVGQWRGPSKLNLFAFDLFPNQRSDKIKMQLSQQASAKK